MMKRAPLATALTRPLALALALAPLAWSGRAGAQPVGHDAGGAEADTLARSIAEEAAALSTDDCASACKALSSMRRAAERLCALEPGPRCDEARRILAQASTKVQAACPACAVGPGRAPDEAAPAPAAPPRTASMEPAAERKSGSCAGCALASSRAGASDLSTLAAAAAALALALRARSRRRR